MIESKQRYDEDTHTLWLWRDYDDPDTLVEEGEVRRWSEVVRDGETEDGRSISHVNYVFADEATAEYNHAPLTFASLGVYVGSLEDPEPYEDGEDLDFEVREDFGIE